MKKIVMTLLTFVAPAALANGFSAELAGKYSLVSNTGGMESSKCQPIANVELSNDRNEVKLETINDESDRGGVDVKIPFGSRCQSGVGETIDGNGIDVCSKSTAKKAVLINYSLDSMDFRTKDTLMLKLSAFDSDTLILKFKSTYAGVAGKVLISATDIFASDDDKSSTECQYKRIK